MSLCIEMPLQLLHDVYVTYSTRHLQAVGRTFQPADVNRNQIFVTIFRIKNFSGSSRLWLSVSDRKTDVQQINMSLSLCMNTFLIFLTWRPFFVESQQMLRKTNEASSYGVIGPNCNQSNRSSSTASLSLYCSGESTRWCKWELLQ